MASNSESNHSNGFIKSSNLKLTIGSGDEDDEVDYTAERLMYDMRQRMQSFAMEDGDMPPTVFLDDADVVPTTSHATDAFCAAEPLAADPSDMDHFVKNFFATDSCLFQNPDQGNFVEEVFTEKPPKIIGDYLFGGVIGEGSYSKVKEVMHVRTLIRRAVKIIKVRLDKRLKKIPGGEQNVQREIQVLQRIKHANVVELFDIFRVEEKQKLYIVMEFCVCSLQLMLDHSEQGKLPEFQAQIYFAQLLDGLDYLHSQRVIHKDIKPGNLLLSLDGRLKICDFGVAEELDGSDEDWCIIGQGTPKFQPPEVVSGANKRFRGRLVDIWSSGVTLYNLVSGEYPFDGEVIMRLFENITTQQLEMPKRTAISATLQQLLAGILEKDPSQRWDSTRIRSAAWFTAKLPIVAEQIVCVPPMNETAPHRPIGICRALEQMFESESSDGHSVELEQPAVAELGVADGSLKDHAEEAKRQDVCDGEAAVFMSSMDGERNGKRVVAIDGQGQTSLEKAPDAAESQRSGSRLSRIFRRKNLTNFLQRLIF